MYSARYVFRDGNAFECSLVGCSSWTAARRTAFSRLALFDSMTDSTLWYLEIRKDSSGYLDFTEESHYYWRRSDGSV